MIKASKRAVASLLVLVLALLAQNPFKNGGGVGSGGTSYTAGTGITITGGGTVLNVNTATILAIDDFQDGKTTFGASSGTNTYTACSAQVMNGAYTAGMLVSVRFVAASTGATTLNWCSGGAKKLLKSDRATQIGNGDLAANSIYTFVYDDLADAAAGAFIQQGAGGGGSRTVTRTFDLARCTFVGGQTPLVDSGSDVALICGNPDYASLDFAASGTARYIRLKMQLPSNWDSASPVNIRLITGQNANPPGSTFYRFQAETKCFADGDTPVTTPDPTWNTAANTGDIATPAQTAAKISTISSVPVTGCAANSYLRIKISRIAPAGSSWTFAVSMFALSVEWKEN